MNIAHKRIVVTGAASGIGLELVKALVAFEGVSVLAADLAPLTFQHKTVQFYQVDCSTQIGNDSLFTHAETILGGVDILFANAGFAYYETIKKADYQHIEAIFRVNTFAPIYGFEWMKTTQTQETITVMTASAMAHLGIPGYALYAATKAALNRFADAYWFEPQTNARLMLVYPVATRSNFFKNSVSSAKIPVTPFPSNSPQFVAKCMIEGVQKGKKRVFPSLLFRVSLVFNQLFSWLAWPYQTFYAKKLNEFIK